MKILTDPKELPAKIQDLVESELETGFIAAVKTTFKPNATIPILWLVIYKSGLLFCSTHKTRRVFQNYSQGEIDSLKLSTSKLEVLFTDIKADDFVATLDLKTDTAKLRTILEAQGYQVL